MGPHYDGSVILIHQTALDHPEHYPEVVLEHAFYAPLDSKKYNDKKLHIEALTILAQLI
jgi:hypothetical protein